METNIKSFKTNIENLMKKYYKVNFVNLLSKVKKHEKKLTNYLENLLQYISIEKVE